MSLHRSSILCSEEVVVDSHVCSSSTALPVFFCSFTFGLAVFPVADCTPGVFRYVVHLVKGEKLYLTGNKWS